MQLRHGVGSLIEIDRSGPLFIKRSDKIVQICGLFLDGKRIAHFAQLSCLSWTESRLNEAYIIMFANGLFAAALPVVVIINWE